MKKKIVLLLQVYCTHIYSAIIIPANGTEETNFAFNVPVTAKAFDPLSGSFIVGLFQGGGEFAISIASEDAPKFIPIAQNNLLTDATVEMLTLAENENESTNTNELLIGTVLVKNNNINNNNVVIILDTQGTQVIASDALNDANTFVLSQSAGIVAIAGANDTVFAAVKDRINNLFGNGDSGIAVLTINSSNTGALSFKPIDAVTGGVGNRAFPINVANTALFGGPGITTYITNTLLNQSPTALYWDEYLNLLYVGLSCQNDAAGNPFMSTVRCSIDKTVGNLVAQPITQTTAIDNNNIVATVGANQVLATEQVAVMHTSTGLSYLIVKAFIANSNTRNIYALPLVDNASSNDHGALANKNAALVDGVFQTAATGPGELPTINDPAAQVGDPANIPSDLQNFIGSITDMVVTGDTVYLSIVGGTNNQFGYVISSQALFNADGTIARWTPWATRAAPVNAFPGLTMPDTNNQHSGKVAFFAVDSVTGNLWLVERDTNRLVGLVSWTNTFIKDSLPYTLNKYFNNGCFSSLDLHHKTSLIGLNNNNYSLFGGLSTIAFARTRDEALSNTSPAGTITDFSDPANFLITHLSQANIPITSLEYTSGNSNNYFIAGSQAGLYIFADQLTGKGFAPADLALLNESPFSNGSWQLAPAKELQKAIVQVICAENNIYIITFDPTDTTNSYNLIAINPAGKTSIQDTFNDANIRVLATSNKDRFKGTVSFNNCAIIHNGAETTQAFLMPEQIILATSQGMWITNASTSATNKGSADAQNEEDANWQPFNELTNQFFNGIGTIDTPIQHTIWPFYVSSSSSCSNSLNSILTQTSQSIKTTPPPPFDPINFNPNISPFSLNTLDPIVYFWTDGARRFFIFTISSFQTNLSRIAVIPFSTPQQTINQPYFINDPAINSDGKFYWVRAIGDLGIILAGTDSGVTALQ
ncbi:hypothetical protein EKK58_02745 [Candidatus Dependentiae bacterium]|nr:MAG: hypothetical protein EKK58_02745 [Candidatus Dependentiae bacterium]